MPDIFATKQRYALAFTFQSSLRHEADRVWQLRRAVWRAALDTWPLVRASTPRKQSGFQLLRLICVSSASLAGVRPPLGR